MSDWLDEFRFAGAELSQGEKSLMRFAMSKERKRIIERLENAIAENGKDSWLDVIELIKGEQK